MHETTFSFKFLDLLQFFFFFLNFCQKTEESRVFIHLFAEVIKFNWQVIILRINQYIITDFEIKMSCLEISKYPLQNTQQ